MNEHADFEALFDRDTKVYQVYLVLRDRQWHCRSCEYTHVGTTQIAGSGGIQGLERGTRKRPGMEIRSANHLCPACDRTTYQDRWTGSLVQPLPAPSMPESFALRAVSVLGSRDVVDNTDRPPNQLTVDHKLPMLRWNEETARIQSDYANMTDEDMRRHFQLLKASNGSISHNLLKSRACERCFKTGRRGTPFGIRFFHAGDARWRPKEKKDPRGCVGCGWHDFEAWRSALNARLQEGS